MYLLQQNCPVIISSAAVAHHVGKSLALVEHQCSMHKYLNTWSIDEEAMASG